MPVPKRRHSYGRKKRKSQHKKPKLPSTVKCSHCGADKIPHRACPECGKYGNVNGGVGMGGGA